MPQGWQQSLPSANEYQKRLADSFLDGCINPFRYYEPRGSAIDVLGSAKPEALISGPAGTGKSRACLEKLNYCALQYPGSRHLILRQARTSLSDTGLVTFERDVLGFDNPLIMDGPQRPWRKSYRYDNGSEIIVGGLDKPGKVLSSEYDTIFIQQAEEVSLKGWEILTTRLRNAKMPFQQLLADCNPQHPSHWLRRRTMSGVVEYIESSHKDNPLLWDGEDWTDEGKRYLSTLDRLTGSTKLRLRYGRWIAPEGQIYSVFDEEKHVVKAFTPSLLWPRAVGIDPFGPYTAAVWVAFDMDNGKLNVYREYLEPFGLTVGGHSENMLRLSQGETIWRWICGAKSERSWRLEYQASGIPVIEPPIVDVWLGIDRIYQLLADRNLVIHDNCTSLLSEIGSYRRKIDRAGHPTDVIEDKNDYHLLDALRYVIASLTQPATTEEVISLIRPI